MRPAYNKLEGILRICMLYGKYELRGLRHRDLTWSSLTGQSMASIEYPWSSLSVPGKTDAEKARDRKISRYADLKEELSNQGWDCGLYTVEVGARGHIPKVVKDRLRSLF
jgi:hypothetical protein